MGERGEKCTLGGSRAAAWRALGWYRGPVSVSTLAARSSSDVRKAVNLFSGSVQFDVRHEFRYKHHSFLAIVAVLLKRLVPTGFVKRLSRPFWQEHALAMERSGSGLWSAPIGYRCRGQDCDINRLNRDESGLLQSGARGYAFSAPINCV